MSSKPPTNMTNPMKSTLSLQEIVDLCITEYVRVRLWPGGYQPGKSVSAKGRYKTSPPSSDTSKTSKPRGSSESGLPVVTARIFKT